VLFGRQRNPAATTLARGGAGWAPRHSDQRRTTSSLGEAQADEIGSVISFTKESVFQTLRKIATDYPCDSPFYVDEYDGSYNVKPDASPSIHSLVSAIRAGSVPVSFLEDIVRDPDMTRMHGIVDFARDMLLAANKSLQGFGVALSERPVGSDISDLYNRIMRTGFSSRSTVRRTILLGRVGEDNFSYDLTPKVPSPYGAIVIGDSSTDSDFFSKASALFPGGPKIGTIAKYAKTIEYHSDVNGKIIVKKAEKDKDSGQFFVRRIWQKWSNVPATHYIDKIRFDQYLNTFAPAKNVTGTPDEIEAKRIETVDNRLSQSPTGLSVNLWYGMTAPATQVEWERAKVARAQIAGSPVNYPVDIIEELNTIPFGTNYKNIDAQEKTAVSYNGVAQSPKNRLRVNFEASNWTNPGPWNEIKPIDVVIALESLSPDEIDRLERYFDWNHDGSTQPYVPSPGGFNIQIDFGSSFNSWAQSMNDSHARKRKGQADRYSLAFMLETIFNLTFEPKKALLAGDLARQIEIEQPGIDESDLRMNWKDMVNWVRDNKKLPYIMARAKDPYADKRIENIVEIREKDKTEEEKSINYKVNALFLWEEEKPTGLAKNITIGLMRVGVHIGLGRIASARALFGQIREFVCSQKLAGNTLSDGEIVEIDRLLENAGHFAKNGVLPPPKPVSADATLALEELANRVTKIDASEYMSMRSEELAVAADDLKKGKFTEEDAPELALKALNEERKLDLEIENSRKEVEAAEFEKEKLEEKKILTQDRLHKALKGDNGQLDGWLSDSLKSVERKFRHEMKRVARSVDRTFSSLTEEAMEVLEPKSVFGFFKDVYGDIEDEAKRFSRRVENETQRFGRQIEKGGKSFGRRFDKNLQRVVKSIAQNAVWINAVAGVLWYIPVIGWIINLVVMSIVAVAEIVFTYKMKTAIKGQLKDALKILRQQIAKLNAEIADLERQAEEAEAQRKVVRALAEEERAIRVIHEEKVEERRASLRREMIIGSAVAVGAATIAERNGTVSKPVALGLSALSISLLAARSLSRGIGSIERLPVAKRPEGLPPAPEPPVKMTISAPDTTKDQKPSAAKDKEAKQRETNLR